MEATYGSILSLSGAMIVGGALGSFGLNFVIRSRRGRGFVKRWRWWGVMLYYLAVAGVVIGGFAWVWRSAFGGDGAATRAAAAALQSPLVFFGFGVIVGLPFTLLTVTSVWRRENRPAERDTPKRKVTRKERTEYAKDLEKQLKEYGGEAAAYHVQLREDKGQVMVISGGMTREQAERLVTALRGEMDDLGFQRVEGRAADRDWWVRV